MRLLFLAKRWHLWRHRFARWALVRILNPLALRLGRVMRESGAQANAMSSTARLRLVTCEKCPVFSNGWCEKSRGGCGCYMPAKVQIDSATCPQKRW